MSRLCALILFTTLIPYLSSCGQEEIDNLTRENEALKAEITSSRFESKELSAKIASLEQENQELKETDQNYFARAMDAFNTANTKSALQATIDKFTQLIDKFPNSQYVSEARKHIGELRKRISELDRSRLAMARLDSALFTHDFGKANKQLAKLKSLVTDTKYKKLKQIVEKEKNKPLYITINKLISDFGTLNKSWDMSVFDYKGKNVQFEATFTIIDRESKTLLAYSAGWGKGSSVRVYYDKSNLAQYFTNTDPQCCDNRYIVTGKTNLYRNTGGLYVTAEKINVIRH